MADLQKKEKYEQQDENNQTSGFQLSNEDNQIFLSVLYLDLEEISDKIEENFKAPESLGSK